MKTHPAITMIQVWALCVLAFVVLPFELVNRTLSWWGFLMLAVFIAAFCVGGVFKSIQVQWAGRARTALPMMGINFGRAEWLLIGASVAATALFAYEVYTGAFLNLEETWQVRSDRASDLMLGRESESSIAFRIAFLLYPAAIVYIAFEVILKQVPQLWRLAAFGGLPVVLASLIMGGRSPLLLALAVAFVSFRVRQKLHSPEKQVRKRLSPRAVLIAAALVVAGLVALKYFIRVFVVRAETAGGFGAMLDVAESSWGITFADNWFLALVGDEISYLIFAFSWYMVQGLVMANVLFTDYVGPPHYGVYGVELITGVMRRVNGDFVADRFYSLTELNTYGFFPSAFGTLYVDLGYGGIFASFVWGYIAALTYQRCRERVDPRWFLVAPIVLVGIFFSFISTPLGFSNGAMMHIWLVVAFLACSVRQDAGARPAREAAGERRPAVELARTASIP